MENASQPALDPIQFLVEICQSLTQNKANVEPTRIAISILVARKNKSSVLFQNELVTHRDFVSEYDFGTHNASQPQARKLATSR
jgi:hypothetical protein